MTDISKATPRPWQWHWRFEDGMATGSIFAEKYTGHAYAVAITPRYQSEERWRADAALIVAAVNAYEPMRLALMQCRAIACNEAYAPSPSGLEATAFSLIVKYADAALATQEN